VATTTSLQGSSPITFTHSTKGQLFVPLTAFTVQGSVVSLASAWTTDIAGNDQVVLLQLAQVKLAMGEVWPATVAPPVPALQFTAAAPGVAGNQLVVTYGPPSTSGGGVAQAEVQVSQVWSGLTGPDDAADNIGVDNPPGGAGPPAAVGGLIEVVYGSLPSTPPSTMPEQQTFTIDAGSQSTQFGVLDTTTPTANVLFQLQAVSGAITTATPELTVTVTPTGSTFSISATYDPDLETVNFADVPNLSTTNPKLAALVGITAPPTGIAVPTPGTVTLAGGTGTANASAIAYTA